jgi:uncharacterized protein (TIGR00730 family)
MSSGLIVAVFGSSQTAPGSQEWEDAERAGSRLAEAGIAVITGGYGGTMEAVSKGSSESGGHVIGVPAPSLFPGRPGANPYVAEVIEAETLTARIQAMVDLSQAAIALPGSIGTATEMFLVWNLNHISRRGGSARHLPTAAVGEPWRRIGRLLEESVGANPVDIHWVPEVDQGVDWVIAGLQ